MEMNMPVQHDSLWDRGMYKGHIGVDTFNINTSLIVRISLE